MPGFDYGAVKQARQVFPGRARMFESDVDPIGEKRLDFNI
jgi:hypothetical protein